MPTFIYDNVFVMQFGSSLTNVFLARAFLKLASSDAVNLTSFMTHRLRIRLEFLLRLRLGWLPAVGKLALKASSATGRATSYTAPTSDATSTIAALAPAITMGVGYAPPNPSNNSYTGIARITAYAYNHQSGMI